ncbi:hypothetical protein D3C75_1094880 [compost metagenome]
MDDHLIERNFLIGQIEATCGSGDVDEMTGIFPSVGIGVRYHQVRIDRFQLAKLFRHDHLTGFPEHDTAVPIVRVQSTAKVSETQG